MSAVNLSSETVAAGRNAVAQELDAARAALDTAQYKAALHPGDKASREGLVQARQRVTALADELAGLESVGRVVVAQERAEGRQRSIDDLRTQEREALAAVDRVPAAFQKVRKAIKALAEAHREWDQAREAARNAVLRCNYDGGLGSLLLSAGVIVREAVLHEGLNGALSTDGCLQRDAAYFETAIQQVVDQARWNIETGTAAQLEALDPSPAAEPEPVADELPEPRRHPAFPGQIGVGEVVEHVHYSA